MTQLIKKLQNPYVKILLAPLAFILFGTIIGMAEVATKHWLNFALLYVIVLVSELVNHFFDLEKNRSQPPAQSVLIIFGIILIIATLFLVPRIYWPASIMLVTYLVYLHLQYFPYNTSKSIYAVFLNTFFQGFVLNAIAYTAQTQHLTGSFIKLLIPLTLMSLAINFEDILLYQSLIFRQLTLPRLITRHHSLIALIITLIATITGIYFSLPSHSFYLVQILFGVFTLLLALPLLVTTKTIHEIQNKLNFFGSIHLIFALLYSLSYLF